MRKIVIAGGTGFLGNCLTTYFNKKNDHVTILTRGKSRTDENIVYLHWDGENLGEWTESIEGSDLLINLNGKSVDCRYTEKNKALIYASRLDATAVLGQAIKACALPPKLWINAASATIYRHAVDKDMDEFTGEIGSGFSVDVCEKWEKAFNQFTLPKTRQVLLRTGIVLGRKEGPLKPLKVLAKLGLGGRQGNGNQFFSWLHEEDFVGMVEFIIQQETLEGAYNVTAPVPVPNREIMMALRKALRMPFGIPMPKWLLEIGALLIGTETELILKSRRVIPSRLLEAGYKFQYSRIEEAMKDLC